MASKYDAQQNINLISVNIVGNIPSIMISPVNAGAVNPQGITNTLFGGRYIETTAGSDLKAGRAVTFKQESGDNDPIRVVYVDGNAGGEFIAESQVIGITLEDQVTNGQIRVAVAGICTILAGNDGTARRGRMVLPVIDQTGRADASVERLANEASIGTCVSQGAILEDVTGMLICIRAGYESF